MAWALADRQSSPAMLLDCLAGLVYLAGLACCGDKIQIAFTQEQIRSIGSSGTNGPAECPRGLQF